MVVPAAANLPGQVMEGIIKMCVTLRRAPLVFQLVRMRQRLAAAADSYIPCSSYLLDVLRSPVLFQKVTQSPGRRRDANGPRPFLVTEVTF